jgi:hypothetical protein
VTDPNKPQPPAGTKVGTLLAISTTLASLAAQVAELAKHIDLEAAATPKGPDAHRAPPAGRDPGPLPASEPAAEAVSRPAAAKSEPAPAAAPPKVEKSQEPAPAPAGAASAATAAPAAPTVAEVLAAMQAHATAMKDHQGAVATLRFIKSVDKSWSNASSVPEARRAELIAKLAENAKLGKAP